MKIIFTVRAFLIFFGFQLTALIGFAQDEPEKQRWQDRLPVSLSGNVRYVSEEFVNKHWHSLRQHRGFSSTPWRYPGNGLHYPNVQEICKGKLFQGEKTEKLKEAIAEANVEEMLRLIKGGVDVNEVGVEGFTLLHLALFLDTDPRPFEVLLKSGADPTACLQLNNPRLVFFAQGMSVAHFAAMPVYNRLFSDVFENNKRACEAKPAGLIERGLPYHCCFQFGKLPADSVERLRIFIDAGVDVDALVNRTSPIRNILGSDDKALRRTTSDLVIVAIEAGADSSSWYWLKQCNCHYQWIHFLARKAIEEPDAFLANEEAQDLLRVLEKRGSSLKEAKDDLSRWKNWQRHGLGELIELEHKMRLKDSTGEALKRWREKGLKLKISELMKSMSYRHYTCFENNV